MRKTNSKKKETSIYADMLDFFRENPDVLNDIVRKAVEESESGSQSEHQRCKKSAKKY